LKFLESFNDQLLWSPPSDTNQDENSSLVMKYLKLAAKERMTIEMRNTSYSSLYLDRTADQELVLEVLLSTDYDIEQALDKLRLPSTNKNDCKFSKY
jgi:hypothetical protein